MTIGASTAAGSSGMNRGQELVVAALNATDLTPGEMYKRVSDGSILMAIGQKVMKETVENAKGIKNF
jgi:hypothetical protein